MTFLSCQSPPRLHHVWTSLSGYCSHSVCHHLMAPWVPSHPDNNGQLNCMVIGRPMVKQRNPLRQTSVLFEGCQIPPPCLFVLIPVWLLAEGCLETICVVLRKLSKGMFFLTLRGPWRVKINMDVGIWGYFSQALCNTMQHEAQVCQFLIQFLLFLGGQQVGTLWRDSAALCCCLL